MRESRLGKTLFLLLLLLLPMSAAGFQGSGPLSVRTEVAPGPFFVGQGFELRIGVVAGGQRPKINPPRIAGARTWLIGTEVRPISSGRIGSVAVRENLFVTRFRVVPARSGMLEIPAVRVQIKDRSGRSQPRSVSIQTVPILGRPAEFLGGVGRFEVHAEASPAVIRVGQELDFRITVTGPAACGMTDRPDLPRYGRLGLGLQIEPRPDETSNEPPVRSFVYHLRPTHAGEAVLPPVAIAAFDPAISRYVTKVTTGVSIRAVAVPPFDPTTVHISPGSTSISKEALVIGIIGSLAVISSAIVLVLRLVRRQRDRPRPCGPALARRFAKQTARYLGSLSVECSDTPPDTDGRVELLNFDGPEFDGNVFHPSQWYPAIRPLIVRASSREVVRSAARRIHERLTSYLLAGTGQSVRVLTPDEAREGVAHLTGSDELVAQAGELTARCDRILYGSFTGDSAGVLRDLLADARRLFEALAQVKGSRVPCARRTASVLSP